MLNLTFFSEHSPGCARALQYWKPVLGVCENNYETQASLVVCSPN